MRTPQELFETVIAHQRKQGQKSNIKLGEGNYSCRYRDPEGRKCAVGCLIPDSDYLPEMEGRDLDQLIDSGFLTIKVRAEFYRNRRLLAALQKVHDQSLSFADWEKGWRMIADDFQLKYPSP